jgi:hypothetical protein
MRFFERNSKIAQIIDPMRENGMRQGAGLWISSSLRAGDHGL